jgi:cytochrome c oxidase cbb3-type subunit III
MRNTYAIACHPRAAAARGTRLWAAMGLMAALTLHAQQPAPDQGGGGRGGGPGRGGRGGGGARADYPPRPPADPAVVERGKALYSVNCQFCHGADTRGGDSGPSLLRSQLVQDDQNGEGIAPVVQNGRPPRMPKFDFNTSQIADLAAFLHSFTINSRDPARVRPPNILTGDATAGQSYFNAKCASCHSTTGDLKGLAARFQDPRELQQWWLMPGGGGRGGDTPAEGTQPVKPLQVTTATITVRPGQKYEGRLVRIDEFSVSIVDADGTTRTFRREGTETPLVEVHDPLQPHKALLRAYTDKDIHDLTAFLVKLQ